MEDELYEQILRNLKETGTVRRLTLMLQNEPLLDRKIAKRIKKAREILNDKVLITIVTNGSLLTPKLTKELIESNPDTISVSIDAFREETYKSTHEGLDFSKVVRNVCSLLEHNRRPKIIARFLKQKANEGEEVMFERYWKTKGADVFSHSVVNRAGSLESFDKIERSETNPFKLFIRRALNRKFRFCPLPFFVMNVLWDGRVILCCHDWGPAVIIGDLKKQSLQKIWNSETMNHYRHLLYTGRSKESPICSGCSHKNGFWSTKKIN
jgi:radical SAM protein with 4Fe4S-binding SPASM domain